MDMEKPRAYVEHPVYGVKMIYLEEREDYLKKGWHKPGEKPVKKKEDPVNEIDEDIKSKSFEEVRDNASDLSDWLNAAYGLQTNRRQGLEKLREIAIEKMAIDHMESGKDSEA